MGISNSYFSIPSVLIHKTAIVEGGGINNAMIYQFGIQFNHCIMSNKSCIRNKQAIQKKSNTQ